MTKNENGNQPQNSITTNDGLTTATATTANFLYEEGHPPQHNGPAVILSDENCYHENCSENSGETRSTETDTRTEKASTTPSSSDPAALHTKVPLEFSDEREKFWKEVVETLGYKWIENRLATEQKGTITPIEQKEKPCEARLPPFRTFCIILILLVFFLVSFVVSVGYTTRYILRGGFNPCPTCS